MKNKSVNFARIAGVLMLLLGLSCAWAQNATAPETVPAVPAVPGGAPGAAAVGGAEAANPVFGPHMKAALIRLDAPVDPMMQRSVIRRIDLARRAGVTLIIFEINTYGGIVTNAIEISQLIKKLPGEGINTAAWVHDKAYSAGAMMSAACQQVVMTSAGAYGDCAPIMVQSTWLGEDRVVPLPPAERAKQTSPITNVFDDSAQRNGWDQTQLRAMVLVEVEIHEIRNSRTNEVRFVDTETNEKLQKEQVEIAGGGREFPWKYVKTVDSEKSLLTVSGEEAVRMGLANAVVANEAQLKGALNIPGELIILPFSWAENATVFLTSLWIRFLLFVAMLILIWLELSHPGISVFGIGALICLILLVGAPFLTGLAQVWEIAVVVVGLGLIIVDVLVFGGVGFLAIPGFILMAIGLVASFFPADPSGSFSGSPNFLQTLIRGLGVLVGGSLVAMVVFYFLARYLYLTPGLNRLQLAPTGVQPPGGAAAAGGALLRDTTDRPADEAVFIGAIGVAATDLRPSGKARFGAHLVGVMTQGGYIAQGTEVVVCEISGMRVVVKAHTPKPNSQPEGGIFP